MKKDAAYHALRKTAQAWVRKTATAELKVIYRAVRVLRRKAGLSVKELSKRAHVTEHLIRRIESGAMPRVGIDKLCGLAFVLAGDVSEFFTFATRGYRRPPEPAALTKLRKLLQKKS